MRIVKERVNLHRDRQGKRVVQGMLELACKGLVCRQASVCTQVLVLDGILQVRWACKLVLVLVCKLELGVVQGALA